MAQKRRTEFEELMAQIKNMPDNDEEDFDEELENKKMRMMLAKEEQELNGMDKQLKMIAGQIGVQYDDPDDGSNFGKGLGIGLSPKGAQNKIGGGQAQQPKKKNASEDLMEMLNNMVNVDQNEVFDEKQHKINLAQYQEDEKEFHNVNKILDQIQGKIGNPQDKPKQQQQQQAATQKQNASQEDQIISQDEQFSSLRDMVCISAYANEFRYCEQYVKNNKLVKIYQHFTTKRQKIADNINKFNTWIISGKLKPNEYFQKYVEGALVNQENLKKQAGSNSTIVKLIETRIKYIKSEIQNMKKNPENIKIILQSAIKIIGEGEVQQQNQPKIQATEILAASQDQLTVPEKLKLLAKLHKQNHNLTLFYKNNLPEMSSAISNFYLPTLQQSQALIKQLVSGQNVSIGSFIETKLLEVTPEVFHKQSIQDFEAKRHFYIDKLDLAQKSEFDLQKMIQNQKKVAKVKEITDQSNLRIKKYEQARSYLQQINYNQYVYFPQIISQNLQLDFSLDNKSIDKNTIIILIKRLVDCKADKFKINYSFTPEQAPLSHQTNWCNQSLVFSDEKKFIMQQGKYPKDLHKKKIDIIMYQKGIFSDSEFARGSISLADLETSNSIDSALILDHKGKHFQLEYGVYIRAPISSIGNKEIQIYDFKQYPTVNINEGVEENIKKYLDEYKVNSQNNQQQETKPPAQQNQQQQQVQQQQQQKQQQQQQQQQQQPQPPQQQQQKQEEEQKAEQEEPNVPNLIEDKFVYRDAKGPEIQKIQAFDNIPPGLTVNDLINLENPSKYRCLSYLACGEKMIENGIKSGEYTSVQRRAISKIKDEFISQQEILNIHCENQKITAEQYLEIQKSLLDDENKVIWVYKQLGLDEWVDFVQARKQIIINDLMVNCEVEYQGKPYP